MIKRLACKYLDRKDKGYVTYGDIFIGVLIITLFAIITLGIIFILGYIWMYHNVPCEEYKSYYTSGYQAEDTCASYKFPENWILQSIYHGIIIVISFLAGLLILVHIIIPLVIIIKDIFRDLCNKKAVVCPRRNN